MSPPFLASPSLVFPLLALVPTLSFPVIPKSIVSHLVILIRPVPVLSFPLEFSPPDAHSAVHTFCNFDCSFRPFPFLFAALHCPDLLSEAVLIYIFTFCRYISSCPSLLISRNPSIYDLAFPNLVVTGSTFKFTTRIFCR